jgi:integrase
MASRTAGNITQRGPDAWLVRVSLPVDETGKRRYYSRTIRGTKKDAQRHLTEKLRELDTGATVAVTKHARQTLRAFLTEWVETKKASERTVSDYRSLIRRYIAPADIGSVRLDQLTALGIRRFYRNLQVSGLGARTVQSVAAVLRHALRAAVRDGLIPRNPETDARDVLEPVVRSEKQVLGMEAARAFLAAVERDRYAALWQLLLETGIRPGEALGLKWSDLEGDVLRVQRALKEPTEKGRPSASSGPRRSEASGPSPCRPPRSRR